jgi:hypothetical protein
MSDDEPIDPEALLAMVAETTVRASPGLVVGEFHPRIGAMAVLTSCRPLSALSAAAMSAMSPLMSGLGPTPAQRLCGRRMARGSAAPLDRIEDETAMIVPVRERSPMGSDAVARLVQQRHEAVGQGRDAESGRGGGALVRTGPRRR